MQPNNYEMLWDGSLLSPQCHEFHPTTRNTTGPRTYLTAHILFSLVVILAALWEFLARFGAKLAGSLAGASNFSGARNGTVPDKKIARNLPPGGAELTVPVSRW